ncbi:hypothetical protein B0H67DRAFT_550692 [Lasiosphaeris hirsuta]|uniref:Xylanolytic transcriptional activator regulatory domain-containing protein n=1 Tax=Lasiosphaeris hirsuta TaxID=260670 RepID=A0AA40AZT5_9PEZI|nr:hypothetical protein B0H67DRAFT_550692 [Lasiosphaeris hirsuta]
MPIPEMETRSHRLGARVANACDISRRLSLYRPATTPQEGGRLLTASPRSRRQSGPPPSTPGVTSSVVPVQSQATPLPTSRDRQPASDPRFSATEEHEETEVPREARLLCDPQGKLIFIGDCAPLSFFQTVRRLVTSHVDAHAFAPETSGYSALENACSRPPVSAAEPPPITVDIKTAVSTYLEVTTGLIDLFDNARLPDDMSAWASRVGTRAGDKAMDIPSAVNYLVLAIGCQKTDDNTSQLYFDYAHHVASASLSGNLGVGNVQVFILITLYMLGACQLNGAFLFFGIAARAAHSIGIHRTSVNSRFGPEMHRQRDRLWKSLRVVDLFLSTSMGRPPATSDNDCTISYRAVGADGRETFDLLNASVQIFLITEAIALEVYSRRKISPRLTEGISRELREWSTRWLQRLKDATDGNLPEKQAETPNGACQVLSSYYYAVILVSRPFLMVELHRRLSDGYVSTTRNGQVSGKSKLADACIDAAILMVEPVQDLIERGLMIRSAPVIVSWLFASSLVLGLGLLGGFGRIIEKYCRASISALEYFAEVDAHAVQYSLIAKSLLTTASEYLEKKEIRERLERTESSSQLFGLVPRVPREANDNLDRTLPNGQSMTESTAGKGANNLDEAAHPDGPSSSFNFDFESTFLGLADSMTPFSAMGGSLELEADQVLGALNLFPLLETDGHIDLANYFQFDR